MKVFIHQGFRSKFKQQYWLFGDVTKVLARKILWGSVRFKSKTIQSCLSRPQSRIVAQVHCFTSLSFASFPLSVQLWLLCRSFLAPPESLEVAFHAACQHLMSVLLEALLSQTSWFNLTFAAVFFFLPFLTFLKCRTQSSVATFNATWQIVWQLCWGFFFFFFLHHAFSLM